MRLLLASAALILLGCGQASTGEISGEPPAGFRYASASNDCAPWDGHAVTILMADRPGSDTGGIGENERPLIRVSVYPREGTPAGAEFHWPADEAEGTAIRCVAEGSCETAASGHITLLTALPDSIVNGTVELGFADGSTVKGGFRARWITRRILCG